MLSDEERFEVWAQVMRALTAPTAVLKTDLRRMVNAADNWSEAEKAQGTDLQALAALTRPAFAQHAKFAAFDAALAGGGQASLALKHQVFRAVVAHREPVVVPVVDDRPRLPAPAVNLASALPLVNALRTLLLERGIARE